MIDATGRMTKVVGDVALTVHASLNWGRCWGKSVDPAHVASVDSIVPFRVVSGDDTWGDWIRIVGPDDMPVQLGMVKFVMQHVIVVDVEEGQAITRLQFAFGDFDTYPTTAPVQAASQVATVAWDRIAPWDAASPHAAVGSGGTYSDVIGRFEDMTTYWLDVMAERAVCGDEAWARCWVAGEDTKWLDFFFETCEYEV